MSPQYLLSVPLKMLRPWAFMGMAAQVSESPDSCWVPWEGGQEFGGGGGVVLQAPEVEPRFAVGLMLLPLTRSIPSRSRWPGSSPNSSGVTMGTRPSGYP